MIANAPFEKDNLGEFGLNCAPGSFRCDAAIVGAGPAGSSCAIMLARAGRRVVLIEKERFPRHKVCGEFLSPACRTLLRRLGTWDEVERLNPPSIPALRISSRRFTLRSAFTDSAHGAPFGITRHALDHLLLERARRVGALVLNPALARAPQTGSDAESASVRRHDIPSIRADTPNGCVSVFANHLIIADGRIRGLATPSDEPRDSVSQVGIKTHLRGVQFERGAIELFTFNGGYVGLSPVEGGLANACSAVDVAAFKRFDNDPRRWFDAIRRQNPLFAARVADAQIILDFLVTPLPRYRFRRPPAGRIAIGAAAAAFDPIIGEGIRTAMESGIQLAELLLNEPCPTTTRIAERFVCRVRRPFRVRDRVARAMVLLSRHDWAATAALAGLSLAPPLLRSIVRASGKE